MDSLKSQIDLFNNLKTQILEQVKRYSDQYYNITYLQRNIDTYLGGKVSNKINFWPPEFEFVLDFWLDSKELTIKTAVIDHDYDNSYVAIEEIKIPIEYLNEVKNNLLLAELTEKEKAAKIIGKDKEKQARYETFLKLKQEFE